MKLKDRPEIRKLAKELGLGTPRDPLEAVRDYCRQKVDQFIKDFGDVRDLNQLLDIVSSRLGVRFEEVHSDDELRALSSRYLSKGEPIFGNLHTELDDKTDAVLIHLKNAKPWERKYVAVIDCRGHKAWRAYFSKWHEIAHILSSPAQLTFNFRRTPTEKVDPIEQVVDRVAGDHAFYSPVFMPPLAKQLRNMGRLTFEVVDNLRASVCCGASREATIRGAVARCSHPQLFMIADYALKKAEERALRQLGLFPEQKRFVPKLRPVQVIGNRIASEAGLWIHPNMEVPPASIIAEAYDGVYGYEAVYRRENLGWWTHSRGKLDDMVIWVEALKSGDRVLALISRVLGTGNMGAERA